jgi:hypothetical protein
LATTEWSCPLYLYRFSVSTPCEPMYPISAPACRHGDCGGGVSGCSRSFWKARGALDRDGVSRRGELRRRDREAEGGWESDGVGVYSTRLSSKHDDTSADRVWAPPLLIGTHGEVPGVATRVMPFSVRLVFFLF